MGATTSKKPAKPAKQAKQKKKKAPADPMVVFAFRLSEAERTRIHDAAGSGKASRFVLAATMAAVDGDVEAFKKVAASRATSR